ncbi:MAG TPA: hypothetical protein VM344_07570 [Vitreimonas sp.]|nr:hypothetical protein [Vitreimonas sp.]
MAQPLKRLGGGRWESKDGRFSIEPQSGTWVIVDNEQVNELGLPLVRGPYPSLTAARTAIEEARDAGPAASPLADRLERVRTQERDGTARPAKTKKPPEPKKRAVPGPKPTVEPAWLRRLSDTDRRRATTMIKRLVSAGVEDPAAIARAEIVDDLPAIATLALERRLAAATRAADPAAAVKAAVDAVLAGRDGDLRAQWRLVDEAGREIRKLDPT